MISPELPEITKPKQVREKPRLSTGEHPVALIAVGAVGVAVPVVSTSTRTYKWQAMDDKVECPVR